MPVLHYPVPTEPILSPFRFVGCLNEYEERLRIEETDVMPDSTVMWLYRYPMPGTYMTPLMDRSPIWWFTTYQFRRPIFSIFESDRLCFPVVFNWPEIDASMCMHHGIRFTLSFKHETLFSLATDVGYAPPSLTYDDPAAAECLAHNAGFEVIRRDEFPWEQLDVSLFIYGNLKPSFRYTGCMHTPWSEDPNDDELQQEIPTIQQWNVEFDKEMRRRFYLQKPEWKMIHALLLNPLSADWTYANLANLQANPELTPRDLSLTILWRPVGDGNDPALADPEESEDSEPRFLETPLRRVRKRFRTLSGLAPLTSRRSLRERTAAKTRSEYPWH